jgi:hypothetical protein
MLTSISDEFCVVTTELGYSLSIILDSTLTVVEPRISRTPGHHLFLHRRHPRVHLHPTVVLIAPRLSFRRTPEVPVRVPPAESPPPLPAFYPHAEQRQRYRRRRDARDCPTGGGRGPLSPAHEISRRQPPCGLRRCTALALSLTYAGRRACRRRWHRVVGRDVRRTPSLGSTHEICDDDDEDHAKTQILRSDVVHFAL